MDQINQPSLTVVEINPAESKFHKSLLESIATIGLAKTGACFTRTIIPILKETDSVLSFASDIGSGCVQPDKSVPAYKFEPIVSAFFMKFLKKELADGSAVRIENLIYQFLEESDISEDHMAPLFQLMDEYIGEGKLLWISGSLHQDACDYVQLPPQSK